MRGVKHIFGTVGRRLRGLPAAAVAVLLAFGTCGLVLGLRAAGWLEPLELRAYDACLRLLPRDDVATPPVVVIGIDEADIQALRDYPIRDGKLADLLAELLKHGPRAVGLDIYRDIQVPGGPEGAADRERLAAVLLGDRRVVCIRHLGSAPEDEVGPPPELAPRELGWDRVGFNDVPPDPDGVVRRALLVHADHGGQSHWSFAYLLAGLYLAGDQVALEAEGGPPAERVVVYNYDVPDNAPPVARGGFPRLRPGEGGYALADAGGFQLLPDFRARGFRTFPLRAVLPEVNDAAARKAAQMLTAEDVRDKVVLIGMTAKSVPDRVLTPTGPGAGVEFHAAVVGQLIRAGRGAGSPVRGWSDWLEPMWVLLWCLLGAGLALAVRSPWALLPAVAAGLAAVAAAGAGGMAAGWWVPTVPPALGWSASAFAVTGYLSRRERADREAMHVLLARHVSAEIAAEIWRRRQELLEHGRLPAREAVATVLFTDIRGFAALSEATEPRQLMDWLNQYMAAMVAAVHDNGGVVYKYIGDAIMAVFGVPIPRAEGQEAEDATNAVRCALQMRKTLGRLNAGWARSGRAEPVCMRVGIYSGRVVAGSLGSADRLEYTVIGRVVNTASRLEGFGKELPEDPEVAAGGCRILIGEPTWRLLGSRFRTKFLGDAKVKGIPNPVPIYGVIEQARGEEPVRQVDRSAGAVGSS